MSNRQVFKLFSAYNIHVSSYVCVWVCVCVCMGGFGCAGVCVCVCVHAGTTYSLEEAMKKFNKVTGACVGGWYCCNDLMLFFLLYRFLAIHLIESSLLPPFFTLSSPLFPSSLPFLPLLVSPSSGFLRHRSDQG